MLVLPHPETWLVPALEGYLDASGDGPEVIGSFLTTVLPVIAAAVLEDAADVIEGMTEPPEVSGGQWLRQRAAQFRTGQIEAPKTADEGEAYERALREQP